MELRYMDNTKNDNYYKEKIIEEINTIQKYVGKMTYEEFISDNITLDAVMFRLIQMIENINNLSVEYRENHPSIPWGEIIGFRNGIVHEYGVTYFVIVYETITKDLEILKDQLD